MKCFLWIRRCFNTIVVWLNTPPNDDDLFGVNVRKTWQTFGHKSGNNINQIKRIVSIDLTEYGVFNYPDPEIEGWRLYRIEYGGCNENCYYEGMVWLPPNFDSWDMTLLFETMQVPEGNKKISEAIKNIHKKYVGKLSNWRSCD